YPSDTRHARSHSALSTRRPHHLVAAGGLPLWIPDESYEEIWLETWPGRSSDCCVGHNSPSDYHLHDESSVGCAFKSQAKPYCRCLHSQDVCCNSSRIKCCLCGDRLHCTVPKLSRERTGGKKAGALATLGNDRLNPGGVGGGRSVCAPHL